MSLLTFQLRVSCPRCGSEAYVHCNDDGQTKRGAHAERIEAAIFDYEMVSWEALQELQNHADEVGEDADR